jgi:hypothetical protein
MRNPQLRTSNVWPLYKSEAKAYIFRLSQDADYFLKKEKEASLKNVLVAHTAEAATRVAVYMKDDFRPHFQDRAAQEDADSTQVG